MNDCAFLSIGLMFFIPGSRFILIVDYLNVKVIVAQISGNLKQFWVIDFNEQGFCIKK